jgi:photosystem II stability/assembly factor-like uncharacterized protein
VSSDAGAHWRLSAKGLPRGVSVTTGLIGDLGSRTIFAGGASGLFRSIDRGAHWDQIRLGLPSDLAVTFVSASPAAPGRLMVGISLAHNHGGKIYTSSDSGSNWREADHGLPATTVPWKGGWSALEPKTAWIAAGGVYRSDDVGQHWRRDAFGLPPHAFVQALTVLPGDAIYGAAGGSLYVLSPTTTAWRPVTAPWQATSLVHELSIGPGSGPIATTASGLFTADFPALDWHDLSATLPPISSVFSLLTSIDGSTVYAGDGNGVWQMSLLGRWIPAGSGIPVASNVRALIALPGPPPRLLCATDYGVFESTTAIDRWRMVNGPPAGRTVSALAYSSRTDTVYAAVVGAGIYYAPAATMHWKSIVNSSKLGYVHVLLADVNGGWLLAGSNLSRDGGRSWHSTGLHSVLAAIQAPARPSTVLAGTAASGLFRSSNGGKDWRHVQALGPESDASVLGTGTGARAGTMFAVDDGFPYESGDDGSTWSKLSSASTPYEITSIGEYPANPGMLAAGTAGGGVVILESGIEPAGLIATPTPSIAPKPTQSPTARATRVLSRTPTVTPSRVPTRTPTVSAAPTFKTLPSRTPTAPVLLPAISPSVNPTPIVVGATYTPSAPGHTDTPVPPVSTPTSTPLPFAVA